MAKFIATLIFLPLFHLFGGVFRSLSENMFPGTLGTVVFIVGLLMLVAVCSGGCAGVLGCGCLTVIVAIIAMIFL